MQTVVELPSYLADAKSAGLDDADRARIVDQIARNPGGGVVIRGAGGARKVRVPRTGEGTSGGFRVITAYLGEHAPVLLLAVYAKNERTDLSDRQRNEIGQFLSTAREAFR